MLDLHTNDRSILTPLTAIIQDQVMKCYSEVDKSYIYFQVSSFPSRGLETGYITSTTDAEMKWKCQLVYFTPEALLENWKWRRLLQSLEYSTQVKVLVIDEAHTIKKVYVYISIVDSIRFY